MANVRFVCDGKNIRMFRLNSSKDLYYVPLIGDEIETSIDDFMNVSSKIKPWFKNKEHKSIRNCTHLNFKVISRKYSLRFSEWELICEPTAESLLYLLKSIKIN